MFRFIHAADIHLDSPLRGLERYEGAPLEEIRSATRRAFDNLVTLAIEEKVAFVLLAGDLYDGDWKDYNTGLFFVQRMQRLQQAGIRVFAIHGNHDAASQLSKSLRLPDNVTLLATRAPQQILLEDLGLAICGQGFATRAVTEDLASAYPQGDARYFTIGLLHTCLDGKPGHEPYAPCTVDSLRSKGYDYWALGHVHKREIVSQDPWIVFPGNLQGRHIRETGAKGCTLVQVEEGVVSSLAHCAVDVMRWAQCTLDVTGSDNPHIVYEQAREIFTQTLEEAEGRPVAARLTLQGACNAHTRLLAEQEYWVQELRSLATGMNGAGLWLEKVQFATRASVLQGEPTEQAIGGLLQGIDALEMDASVREEVLTPLRALRNKLPPELLQGEERFDPTSEEVLQNSLEEVKALLARRLMSADGH